MSVSETVLIAPYNDLDTTAQLVQPVAERLAAIIVEPVQRSLTPRPGFLAGLRALCDRTGALLVFDEVVTGFRLALGGAQEAFGVTPDLCALGKVIGGGLPLAAVAGRRDVLELTVPDRADDGRSVYLSGTLTVTRSPPLLALRPSTCLSRRTGQAPCRDRRKLAQGFAECAQQARCAATDDRAASLREPVFGEGEFGLSQLRSYQPHRVAVCSESSCSSAISLSIRRARSTCRRCTTTNRSRPLARASFEAMRVIRDNGLLT